MDAGLDREWAARPFALLRTDKLTDARTSALLRIRSVDPTKPGDTETQRTVSKDQWTVQAMTVELERRADLSPSQAAIERTATATSVLPRPTGKATRAAIVERLRATDDLTDEKAVDALADTALAHGGSPAKEPMTDSGKVSSLPRSIRS